VVARPADASFEALGGEVGVDAHGRDYIKPCP
jgi:hypothetical protein